jgi:SAM-dependent methyltransferase
MTPNFWDDRYSSIGYVYGTEPNEFVASQAHLIPPGPVLCLAEGEGRNAVFLAGRGHDVTAVDASAVGLSKASRLAAAKGLPLKVVVADLADYRIEPGAWSAIVATWAHLPPELRRRVHAQAAKGLAPGGVFLLEAYTPDQIRRATGGPKEPKLCMTLGALREELGPLDYVVGRECVRDVFEGTGHTGTASVVQVCARRPAA